MKYRKITASQKWFYYILQALIRCKFYETLAWTAFQPKYQTMMEIAGVVEKNVNDHFTVKFLSIHNPKNY
jgi:hypothetical protein